MRQGYELNHRPFDLIVDVRTALLIDAANVVYVGNGFPNSCVL